MPLSAVPAAVADWSFHARAPYPFLAGKVRVEHEVTISRRSQKAIVLGAIREVASRVTAELEGVFGCKVVLMLRVREQA